MIKKFNIKDWGIITVLVWMIALESLSIDLYLPAFGAMAEDMKVKYGDIQVSLSFFLGGFAIGQLLWGTLADKIGRKRPVIIGFMIYIIASVLLANTSNLFELWIYRFFQAFGGSSGIVIARVVVIDLFKEDQVAKVFSLLMLAMGIAPVIAPSIGTILLLHLHWQGIFYTMAIFGVIGIASVHFILPETYQKTTKGHYKLSQNIINRYIAILKNKTFLLFTLAGSMAYSGLMIYVANSPYMIIEKAGYNEKAFSIIFALNAVTLMLATFTVHIILKYTSEISIVKTSAIIMTVIGFLCVTCIFINAPINYLIILCGLYLFVSGFILPTSTAIALRGFEVHESGKASALLGFLQLLITSGMSLCAGFLHQESLKSFVVFLLICGVITIFASCYPRNNKAALIPS